MTNWIHLPTDPESVTLMCLEHNFEEHMLAVWKEAKIFDSDARVPVLLNWHWDIRDTWLPDRFPVEVLAVSPNSNLYWMLQGAAFELAGEPVQVDNRFSDHPFYRYCQRKCRDRAYRIYQELTQ